MNSLKLLIKINTLQNKVASLETIIKDELYKEFIDNQSLRDQVDTLKEDKKKLRKKLREEKEKNESTRA